MVAEVIIVVDSMANRLKAVWIKGTQEVPLTLMRSSNGIAPEQWLANPFKYIQRDVPASQIRVRLKCSDFHFSLFSRWLKAWRRTESEGVSIELLHEKNEMAAPLHERLKELSRVGNDMLTLRCQLRGRVEGLQFWVDKDTRVLSKSSSDGVVRVFVDGPAAGKVQHQLAGDSRFVSLPGGEWRYSPHQYTPIAGAPAEEVFPVFFRLVKSEVACAGEVVFRVEDFLDEEYIDFLSDSRERSLGQRWVVGAERITTVLSDYLENWWQKAAYVAMISCFQKQEAAVWSEMKRDISSQKVVAQMLDFPLCEFEKDYCEFNKGEVCSIRLLCVPSFARNPRIRLDDERMPGIVSGADRITNGKLTLTACKKGTTELRYVTDAGQVLKPIRVEVHDPVYCKSLEIVDLPEPLILEAGGAAVPFSVRCTPEHADDAGELSWTSSRADIIRVSSDRKITPVKAGSAELVVKSTKVTLKHRVQVKPPLQSIVPDQSSLSLHIGATHKMKWTLTPPNCFDSSVNIQILDKGIVVLEEGSTLKGKGIGTTKVILESRHTPSIRTEVMVTVDHRPEHEDYEKAFYLAAILSTVFCLFPLLSLVLLIGEVIYGYIVLGRNPEKIYWLGGVGLAQTVVFFCLHNNVF